VGSGSTSHSFAVELHEAVRELPRPGRGREATQFVPAVSINTIDTPSVFAKLGVQSRVQLANVLHKEIAT
jgi:hypothetical protein